MTISLYDATVPHFLQLLGSLRGVLAKGLDHARATGLDPETLTEARLIEDMFPLRTQVQRVADHSRGALNDVRNGAFTLPRQDACDYAGLERLLRDAEAAVRGWTPEAVNALQGREVILDAGSRRTAFTAESYLLCFSLPNFYFHGVTAYDILRSKGVPIGKRDYLSQMQTKLG